MMFCVQFIASKSSDASAQLHRQRIFDDWISRPCQAWL